MKKPSARSKTLSTTALALAISALLLAGCDSTPSTVKIGVAQPLTGPVGELGQDLLNGVKLAVNELNKEGYKINGKPVTIEIVAMDDRGDPATGKEVAQKMLDAGVVAVIGHLNSGVSIEAAPVYASKDIAQLAISTNPKFTQMGLATAYRLVANDTLQAKAIGSFAVNQLKSTRYAMVDEGTVYGKDLANGALEQLKLAKKEVRFRESFDDKTTAFNGLADKIKQEKIEVLVTILNDFQVLALIDALQKINYTDVTILGADIFKTTHMLEGADKIKGLYVTSPTLDAKEFSNGKKFLANYQNAYKIEPTYGGHYTYDAMYVLAGAMQHANSTDPKKITETLRNFDGYAPVTGSMKWNSEGEQRYGVVGIYAARKAAWELQLRSDSW